MTIVWHHVGGRGGQDDFLAPAMFAADIQAISYDADGGPCLSDREGEAAFHLNFDRNTSSLFPVNPAFNGYYVGNRFGADSPFPMVYGTEVEIPVKTITLDKLIRDGRAPDVLTIDVQGAAYEVIAGGRNILQDCLWIMAEVEFRPLYLGQRVFGDVCALAESLGFTFAFFSSIRKFSPYRHPLAARGKGLDVCAEAHFVRMPDTITDKDALRRLAFIAITYDQFDIAFECLRRAPPENGTNPSTQFLDQIWSAYLDAGPLPPLADPQHIGVGPRVLSGPGRNAVRNFIAKWPRLLRVFRALTAARRSLRLAILPLSPIEAVLDAHGFHTQADNLRQRRKRLSG